MNSTLILQWHVRETTAIGSGSGCKTTAEASKIRLAWSPRVGMKTVGNGRENVLTISAPVFFCRERKREREGRTGKRNRYYGISGTEYFERERLDYDREAVTQNGNIYM